MPRSDTNDFLTEQFDKIEALEVELNRIKTVLKEYLSLGSLDGKPIRQEYRAVLAKLIK